MSECRLLHPPDYSQQEAKLYEALEGGYITVRLKLDQRGLAPEDLGFPSIPAQPETPLMSPETLTPPDDLAGELLEHVMAELEHALDDTDELERLRSGILAA